MLPISPTLILDELKGIQAITNKWIERITEGIPTLTFEARDEDYEMFIKHLVGELRVLAGKGDNLADIISEVR